MSRALYDRHWRLLQWLAHNAPARVTADSRPVIDLFVLYHYVSLSSDGKVVTITDKGRVALRDRYAFDFFYRCPFCNNPSSAPMRGVLHRTELLNVEEDGFLEVGCRDCKRSHISCHPDLYGKLPVSKPALERERLLSKGKLA